MRSLPLLTSAALVVLAPAAQAQVLVQTPWVTVRVCPTEVTVQSGPLAIRVPRCARAAPAPILAPQMPPAQPEPGAPPPVPEEAVEKAVQAPTLAQFAGAFRPRGGRYETVLLHPATGQPVQVAFTLPDGPPRKVRVYRYRLAFDYGRRTVALVFRRDGSVHVRD
jgi:hypothetical protein